MHFEYSLRATNNTQRVLMERAINDGEPKPRPWVDLATFHSYNDAERILSLINEALEARRG